MAVNVKTGKPAENFGDHGVVNLKTPEIMRGYVKNYALTSPPGIYKNLVMTGGSDVHGPHEATHAFGFNHVLAAERTQAAILAGVSAGHNYISSGPSLLLETSLANGQMATMGDHVEATGAGKINIGWGNASAGNVLHVMQDGKSIAAHKVNATGDMTQAVHPAGRSFVNLELRAADGQLRAITNPLFFG